MKNKFERFKEEIYSNCKNKDKQDCNIRIFAIERTIYTKCDYYERED